MAQNQINLTLPDSLLLAAKDYSEKFGYRNVQELAMECLRQAVFRKDYDEDFTEKELALVEKFMTVTLPDKRLLASEKDLDKALLG